MHTLLSRLRATSRYQRELISPNEEILHSDDDVFSVVRLTDCKDARLPSVIKLLSGTFEEGMDNSERISQEWVSDPTIAYHAVCDAKGKVIAAANSSCLPLVGRLDFPESILAVWYVAIDQGYRGRKLVHELYHSMYEFFLNQSLDLGTSMRSIVGEASHDNLETISRVLSRPEISRKRVYCDIGDNLVEVPYISPPLRWNSGRRRSN
ncbi:hypothetical protein J4444_02860 [Candidatus Woesearchaeota archaeon]|nr:hypothetical protein [Candidatus Woesearchaeota archaeon]